MDVAARAPISGSSQVTVLVRPLSSAADPGRVAAMAILSLERGLRSKQTLAGEGGVLGMRGTPGRARHAGGARPRRPAPRSLSRGGGQAGLSLPLTPAPTCRRRHRL